MAHHHSFIFRWIAIPWLQSELDEFRDRFNNTARRSDRHSILPRGPPNNVYEFPGNYRNIKDFKVRRYIANIQHDSYRPQVPVPDNVFDQAEQIWAPPDHAVFELVPPVVNEKIQFIYDQLDRPEVNIETFWPVYRHMLARWTQLITLERDPAVDQVINHYADVPEGGEDQGIPANLPRPMNWGEGDLPHLAVYGELQDGRQIRVPEKDLGQVYQVYEAEFSDDEEYY
jgi:hypothetical protein